jgi:hypothetical protein
LITKDLLVQTDQLTSWAVANPWPTATITAAVLTVTALTVRSVARRLGRLHMPPGPVRVAALGAAVCTAYAADTSWGFARDWLGMHDVTERAALFAAAEIALLSCGLMARANKAATTTEEEAGTPGVAGILMWIITGVQVIPCYAQSGMVGGTVRAIIGPVMAGMLWHLAMGLEIRVVRPQALSTGLPAIIGRELRERLLSHMGLAARNRTAEQITRDRAAARAVRLGSRRWLGFWGKARLAAALARTGAATDGQLRHSLMQQLAGRRSAESLRTVPVVSPWVQQPVPEPYPRTPLGVTGDQLRRMEPLEAILCVHRARPEATRSELAALCTEYGVPVTEVQAGLALRARQWGTGSVIDPTAPEPPELSAIPDDVPAAPPTETPVPEVQPEEPGPEADEVPADLPEVQPEAAVPDDVPAPSPAETPAPVPVDVPEVQPEVHVPEPAVICVQGIVLDLPNPMAPPVPVLAADQPRVEVHARVPPDPTSAEPVDLVKRHPREEPNPTPPPPPSTGVPAELLDRARVLDAEYRRTHDGRPVSIRVLKAGLRIGQPRAEQVRAALAERPTP